MSILVPLDGSKNSERGLNFAFRIASPSKSKVTGLHIVKSGEYVPTAKLKKTGQKILESAEKKAKRNDVSFSKKIRVGANTAKEIIKFSKQYGFDLIVIGSRGPDSEMEIFPGSVANFVFHKSRIPVTVVK